MAAKKRDPKCFYLPKDAEEAHERAVEAQSRLANRDQRMLEDERAYQLMRRPLRPGQTRQTLNDCAVQVDAADDLMATVDLQIQVATDEEARAELAQDAEDLLRYVWQEWIRRHARAGLGALQWNICHSLNLYGWLVPRLLVNPQDRRLPVSLELLDPRRVYLDRLDGAPDCVYYFTEASPEYLFRKYDRAAVRRALPDAKDDDRQSVPLIAYHTDHETALSHGGEWIKKPTPHEYGVNPVQVFMASGATFRGPSPAALDVTLDTDWPPDDFDKFIGTGFLETIRPVVEDAERIALLRAELLAASANPTRIAKLRTTELEEFPPAVGGTARLTPDEGYETHPPPPQALQFAMQLSQERAFQIYQAGINQVLLGGGESSAGVDRLLLSAAGARRLRPRVEVFQLALCQIFETFLHLYASFASVTTPMRYMSRNRDTGIPTIATRLQPSELRLADLRVEVQLGEIGVPDQQQRATIASMLVREGLASQEYALTEIIRAQNPQQVMKQTRKDQVWQIPQVVEAMALWEVAQDDKLGPLQAAAQAALPASMQRLLQLAQPPQPPGPAPGQLPGPAPAMAGQPAPPMPGSPLPSAPQGGVPPSVSPPALQNPMVPNGAAPPGPMPPEAALPRI